MDQNTWPTSLIDKGVSGTSQRQPRNRRLGVRPLCSPGLVLTSASLLLILSFAWNLTCLNQRKLPRSSPCLRARPHTPAPAEGNELPPLPASSSLPPSSLVFISLTPQRDLCLQASRNLGYGHAHGCCGLLSKSPCCLAAGLTLALPFVCPREKSEQKESRACLAFPEEPVQLGPR